MSLVRREFSKKECEGIKKLLAEKLNAPEKDQKRIRRELRNKYGFWISFFTNQKPFSEDHFTELIKRKVITCRD
jgi:hypothetical protein